MNSLSAPGVLRPSARPFPQRPESSNVSRTAFASSCPSNVSLVPLPTRPLGDLSCRSSSIPGTAVSQAGQKPEPRQRASSNSLPQKDLPQELSSLTDLVSQLSAQPGEGDDVKVTEMKKAFGVLTEDIKKQLSTIKLTSDPRAAAGAAGAALRSGSRPGGGSGAGSGPSPYSVRRLSPATDAESGMRDLEGLIPQSKARARAKAKEAEDGEEPSVPKSQVTQMRSRLNKKLSESNTYNRFLMREIQYREDAIRDTKAVLVALLSEMREVAAAVGELASVQSFVPPSSVSPSCMPSVVHAKLQGLLGDLDRQLAGVDAMKLREVPLVWYGMAEDVKVMGTFDGWTYGEQMSPETTGSMTRFSTVLKLRPGSYEIKFLVDGEWRIAPEWPTVGNGMTENNSLVVD